MKIFLMKVWYKESPISKSVLLPNYNIHTDGEYYREDDFDEYFWDTFTFKLSSIEL